MKIGKLPIIFMRLVILVLFFPLALFAKPSIEAKVSSTNIGINDTLVLTVKLTDVGNLRTPPRLNIPNFEIQSAGSTKSVQFINGKTTTQVSFNYRLRPLKTGTLKIPPISLQHDNQTFQTHSITVHVKQRSRTQSPSRSASGSKTISVPSEGLKPVFMTAKVDKSKVYVGEQIFLTVQFLRRPGVRIASQPQYSEPDMTGFLVEPLKQQEFSTTLEGHPYEVTELRYALFPTSDGQFAIGSANIALVVRNQPDPFNSQSFFDSFFGRNQTVRLKTRAIPIQVRFLPENKPTNFSGSVGRYRISAKVDHKDPEVGKPLNLIVWVEGVGNIKSIREPWFPPLNSFRKYETLSNSKVDNTGQFINGHKEFKTLIIPQVSGELIIPEIYFSYFNPQTHAYVTAQTKPIILNVKPGSLSQSDFETTLSLAAGQVREGVRVVDKDIRFIKQGKIKSLSSPFYQSSAFIILNTLPPLFAAGALLTLWQSRRRHQNASLYRSQGALHQAQKHIKVAKKQITNTDPALFYSHLNEALTSYLADKFSLSSTGLVWTDVDIRMTDKNVPETVRQNVRQILDEADMARFATSSFDDEAREKSLLLTELTLKELNKVLS